MEKACSELSRILGYPNPYAWSIDNHNEKSVHDHRYYFQDQEGVNEMGDTSLHRLVALHASQHVLANFLTHAREHDRRIRQGEELGRYANLPPPPTIHQTNKKGVSALHVAVFRNSWYVDEIAQVLLSFAPELARIPMTECQSYPLHILTGHSITIKRRALDILLEAEPTVVWKFDVAGDTPLSLLWKNVVRFRWARRWEEEGVGPVKLAGGLSWMTVISPTQFLEYSLALLEAAFMNEDDTVRGDVGRCRHRSKLSWHDVCGFPKCPTLLVRLLLQEPDAVCGGLFSCDEKGRLPLHVALASSPVAATPSWASSSKMLSPLGLESVSELLLTATSNKAAGFIDSTGRFPLHYACRQPEQPVHVLRRLLEVSPQALRYPDPETGLYPVQQVASSRMNGESCPNDALELIFQMMRACPDIV